MRTTILAALVVAAMAHALAWFVAARTTTPPDISNTVESMSFNVLPPGTDKLSPEEHARRRARIDDRLRTIAGMTRTVRSYSSVAGHRWAGAGVGRRIVPGGCLPTCARHTCSRADRPSCASRPNPYPQRGECAHAGNNYPSIHHFPP